MIDAHCHLQEVENIARQIQGLDAVVCCGSGYTTSNQAVTLAAHYPTIFATVGVHPEELEAIKRLSYEDIKKSLLELTKFPKVVAIGECGLDYTEQTTPTEQAQQIELLKFNVELAKHTHLPLVVHCRNAFADLYEILNTQCSMLNGVQLHCWTGSWDWAKKFLDLGCYLSFGGILTFKSSHNLREVARHVPEERLLIETDSPYLAPEPLRGSRNSPQNVKIVAQTLAEVRGISIGEIDRLTSNNVRVLFGLYDN